MKQSVLVIFGPTASGKTALAERLFASSVPLCRTEVINADSMQVYKGMDIGTAKPDAQLCSRLPHHLLDLVNPNEQFSAGDFVRHADDCCASLQTRGIVPLVLGGTAFYIRNFLYGLPKTPQADEQTRNDLKQRMKEQGADVMHEYLAQLDPQSAERIHVNDEYRILRALEVCIAGGKPLSAFRLEQVPRDRYRFLLIALERPKEELAARIEQRVDQMFDLGLATEVAELRSRGYTAVDPGMQAIGYREFFASDNLETVCELIKTNSKKYAKRQMTFFRSIPGVKWYNPNEIDKIELHIQQFLSGFLL